jgi:hypothetical protein
MAFGVEQDQSITNGRTSSGITEYTLNINGETFCVIDLPILLIRVHCNWQASEEKEGTGTPIDRLPNELVSYIFTLGSEAEEDGDHDDDNEGEQDIRGYCSHSKCSSLMFADAGVPLLSRFRHSGLISTLQRAPLLTSLAPGWNVPKGVLWT